ncbi:hypothetical protein E2C01_062185 [Portunus trituberculatus]|uniref:Uncharacterized protein n=1 Tax=Portunus trituberculatus TaxID=210409 RepID=A0A5B7HDD0_PORTR|nr:hypothetical protein [Portunus trituberculatus]
MVKAAWRQEVKWRNVACLNNGWGESKAEEATQGSVSLHFCLAGWQQIWDGGKFDQVGGAKDMNIKLASQSVEP